MDRISMRRYPYGTWKRREYVRRWLEANDAFLATSGYTQDDVVAASAA